VTFPAKVAAGGGGSSCGTAVAASRDGDDEGRSPVDFIQFNNGGEEDEEVEEISVANSWRNVVDDAGRPRLQSMPAFGSKDRATAAVTSSSTAIRGGATTTRNAQPAPPRRSPSLMSTTASSVGGGGGQKTKNSTNRERGSISKAMDRMAQSLESGGGGGGESMMISMLSNQMQQTAQNMSMQQSHFHQQMQMQLASTDKRAEMSEKYLCQITKCLLRIKSVRRAGVMMRKTLQMMTSQ
jgi:hypothetical protein